ncbi:GTP-binding protein HflX [gamma proteobacterium BDW918]|uniref:GTPase HflX n=1 Tax=Zhongshania aliphaticivorans TaxID=1470434 RepID=A0A127M2K0_9GAMM|nr:ribosome rescue GTPase HflX [Zhongshania aliphaticivorans]AMO67447.1 GTPase HflX [Zhongshania aliphaticivorans]EIF42953.1 GTP-binding protein HflX [gamma proteobacterium BDW918]
MLFERPNSGERAILVHLDFHSEDEREDSNEFVQLVTSAGGDPVAFITGSRKRPDARLFVGTGKLEEIREALIANEGELVLFNHSLSPSQERNIERELQCRVLDRTGLILDIFAQRAHTHEGKLQVELAQLQHMSTRLVRGWTHLERQKGGIGLRGPGESQLETDRRLLRARITAIQSRLQKVRRQREQARRARRRAEIPALSLVGYTNAGKSTLFNVLTTSSVYAADQLFATLDPTVRRITVDDVGPVILADTVGFIRHLPHKLVEAFRATLEEAVIADLLIHVVDCADPERQDNMKQVMNVLAEIGAADIPILEVYNKTDLIGSEPRIERDEAGQPVRVWLSARDDRGLDLFYQALSELLGNEICETSITLTAAQGRLRARLFSFDAVLDEEMNDDGSQRLKVRLPEADWQRLLAGESITEASLDSSRPVSMREEFC